MDSTRHPPWDEPARLQALEVIGRAVAEDPRVRFALVFGSFARGRPFRDIDVAVSFDEPWDYLDAGRLGGRIEVALGTRAVDVDVIPLEAASPLLRLAAARDGILVYERRPGLYPPFFSLAVLEGNDLLASLRRAGHPLGGMGR